MSTINSHEPKLYDTMVLLHEKEYENLKNNTAAANAIPNEQAMQDNNKVSNLEINNEGGVVLMQPESSDHREQQHHGPDSNSHESSPIDTANRKNNLTSSRNTSDPSLTHNKKELNQARRALIRIHEKSHKNPSPATNPHSTPTSPADGEKKSNESLRKDGRKILKAKNKLPKSRKRKSETNLEDDLYETNSLKEKKRKKSSNTENQDDIIPMDTSEPFSTRAIANHMHVPLKKMNFKNSLINNIDKSEPMDYESPTKRGKKRMLNVDDVPLGKKNRQSAIDYINQRHAELHGNRKRKNKTESAQSNLTSKKKYKSSSKGPTKRSRTKDDSSDSDEDDDEGVAERKRRRNNLSNWNIHGKRKRDPKDTDLKYFAERFLEANNFLQNSNYEKSHKKSDLYDNDGDYIML